MDHSFALIRQTVERISLFLVFDPGTVSSFGKNPTVIPFGISFGRIQQFQSTVYKYTPCKNVVKP